MALVTFDELTVDDLFLPAITTVVQPAFDIGFRAAEILLNRIEGTVPDGESVSLRLPATLKVCDSSRARSANGREQFYPATYQFDSRP